MNKKIDIAVVWFRQDLRLLDNPALYYAATEHRHIIPLYILDDTLPRALGGAQHWWLHHSLVALQNQLHELGAHLILRRGDPLEILSELSKEQSIAALYWNRCYEPAIIARDMEIKNKLSAQGLQVKSYNGSLLHEPWQITNQQGNYFKIFTAYWKSCCQRAIDTNLLPIPPLKQKITLTGESLSSWNLLPSKPNWATGLQQTWQPGELQAQKMLDLFVTTKLKGYATQRDIPAENATSLLSPYLHFGEISLKQIWQAAKTAELFDSSLVKDCERFLAELGWREFSYYLLYHFPKLSEKNYQKKFDQFAWSNNAKLLTCWQKGQTGFPIVDAGMRELWQTGYMHNRVRMIVASFLTKHLLIDWRLGAEWFLDTLIDADLANNSMNWQWVAGSGVDAAPYFRIFNPILQGEKFDPEGLYVRRWVPELVNLPDKYIHKPWLASTQLLQTVGLTLGVNYPNPIVEHAKARALALAKYKNLKLI